MMKTVFVTGASGFLGGWVVKLLLKEGHRVIALVRSLPKKDIGGKLLFIKGDVTHNNLGIGKKDYDLLQKTEYFIHCAAIAHFQERNPGLFKTNVQGTKNILDFARKLPNLKALIHISSKAVAGNYEGVFPEQTLPVVISFHNAYEKSKYEAELLVRESRLPYIIVRPPTIVGDSKTGSADRFEGSAYKLIAALKRRRLPFYPSRCEGYLYIMPVDKVAEFIVRLCFDSEYIGKTFNLSDSSPLTFKEFIDTSAKLLKVPAPSFTLPGPFWNLFLSAVSRFSLTNAGSLSLLNQKIKYENKAFTSASDKYGIKYPSLVSYLPNLIKFYQQNS